MKYLAFSILGVFLSVASGLQADYYEEYSHAEPICCEPCFELSRSNFVINGDFLYWRALQNGLSSGWGPDTKERWNPSYRIGAEYDFADIDWSIAACFTSYNSRSNRGKKSNLEEDHIHWKLNYETVDVLVKHPFHYCNYSYTPYFGVRGAWINEKLRSHFDENTCEVSTTNLVTIDLHHKERFWGVGPCIGLMGDWTIGSGFGIYGSFGVGMLYGNFKIQVEDLETFTNPTDEGSFCDRRHVNACQAFIDAAVGIQYERCVYGNTVATIRLGLEHHRYFNHNQIGGYGDLCLDGGVLSVRLTF